MKRGGMIVVTVSRGPENRALPPVENLTFEQASQQVNALGFIPSKEERYDDEGACRPGDRLPGLQ